MGSPFNIFFFFFCQMVLISWMVTLSSCLIWKIISCILPPNENDHPMCLRFAKWACRRCLLAQKNLLFRWSLFSSWRLCKQAKLPYLGHRKRARIHWKADAPKTSQCLVWIFVKRHNWAIFLWEAIKAHIDRYRAMLNEFLFTKIEEDEVENMPVVADRKKFFRETFSWETLFNFRIFLRDVAVA